MRIAIVGLGGIGASIGLARRAVGTERLGYDIAPEAIQGALSIGAIDRPLQDLAECAQAEIVILAVPPMAVPSVLRGLAPVLSPHTVLTDTTSIKAPVLEWVKQTLLYPNRFVGGHPIAGTEQSGWASARSDLFQGAQWGLTPLPDTDPDALQVVQRLVQAVGAVPILMEADQHDREVALLSHLPHVVAFSLSALHRQQPTVLQGGSSWHSATRVALSDPTLWSQILTLNRTYLLEHLRLFQAQLHALIALLETGDESQVERFLIEAR